MIIVRAFPDAAGSKHVQTKDCKNNFCRNGFVEDRMMRVIMVNHKHSGKQKTGAYARNNAIDNINIQKCCRIAGNKKKQCRESAVPTPPSDFLRIRARGEYEFFSCFHKISRTNINNIPKNKILLSTLMLPSPMRPKPCFRIFKNFFF